MNARTHGSATARAELRRIEARLRLVSIAADLETYPNDPEGYAERVRQLEAEDLPTSDAQAVADAEHRDGTLAQWLREVQEAAK